MRSPRPLSTGMPIAIPLSGASAAHTGRVALRESPCCRGRHDFPDDPLRSERAYDTRLTSAISGRPARGLVSRLILHGIAPGCPPACAYPLAYDAAKLLHAAAAAQGND